MALVFETKFLDDIRDAVPLRSVVGRRAKLERSGSHWKCCCPFHGEKTASFNVYDDHFHCYGCGAHGDVFSFVMQSEGATFPEAVSALAAEAGLQMPKPDSATIEKEAQSSRLRSVLQEAASFYHKSLSEARGRSARQYLLDRSLTPATIELFELGWADSDHQRLLTALKQKGFLDQDFVAAGLLRAEAGGAAFFSRVMFPIHDRRGQIISFGGRTLGDGLPKYVNGAETPLFSKKRTLYNLHRASTAVRREKQSLLVVEGYMDVIALSQGGFVGAVAPLGTAITVEQLEMMWRETPAPIICLDGDAAGSRASLRVAELALPLMTADKTLRFCRLPPGEDPDSIIRSGGKEAMRALLSESHSLLDEVFALMRAQCDAAVPEQRAALKQRLDAAASQIRDRTLGYEYRRSWRDKAFESFRQANRQTGLGQNYGGRKPHISVGTAPNVQGETERLNILTEMLLRHPSLLDEVEEAFGGLALPPELAALREGLFEWSAQRDALDGAQAEAPELWFDAMASLDDAFAKCAATARKLIKKYEPFAKPRNGGDDGLLATDLHQRWWHFYGLVNFAAFQAEVTKDIASAVLDMSLEKIPDALKARLHVLERIKAGEPPDEA